MTTLYEEKKVINAVAPATPPEMGAVTMLSLSKNTYPCDRMAVDRAGNVYLLCVSGSSTAMKALFAFLNTNVKGTLEPDPYMRFDTSLGNTVCPRQYTKVYGGYRIYRDKMDFGTWHCGIVSKSPKFITSVSDEALWQQLNQPRFTTPLIRAWVPYVRRTLIQTGWLVETYGFQTRCGLISVTSEDLDKIVCKGLQDGDITIPEDD